MPHLLKNNSLEIHIDLPPENYNGSRFDWTGKIVKVKFEDKEVTGIERTDAAEGQQIGKGMYNEFGMDAALGFEEAGVGEWFHKIGVGLLKKDAGPYLFHKAYEVKPAVFEIEREPTKMRIVCRSAALNGYSYVLEKEIELLDSGFVIRYHLRNTGEKTIETSEYCHNFIAINRELVGEDYIVRFPFQVKPERFGETVNPEQQVKVGQQEFTFNGAPEEPFFFSNLSGDEIVEAAWEVINLKTHIGISETGSFQTNKVNLWGWKHVISPELFFGIVIEPGQSLEWSRTYRVFVIK